MSSPVSPNPLKSPLVYTFGQFELRAATGELIRNGHARRLPEQPLQILLALLEQPGEIVSREALRERLWSENTFVDFELGLNAAVKRLRRALQDDFVNPRFIETLPRRGYRFLAPVTAAADAQMGRAAGLDSGAGEDAAGQPEGKRYYSRRFVWLTISAAIVACAGAAFVMWRTTPTPKQNRAVRRYSVVLPEGAALAPASLCRWAWEDRMWPSRAMAGRLCWQGRREARRNCSCATIRAGRLMRWTGPKAQTRRFFRRTGSGLDFSPTAS